MWMQELLDPSRWHQLIELFRKENFKLFQLSQESVFTVTLQAGLSALKTPYLLSFQAITANYFFKLIMPRDDNIFHPFIHSMFHRFSALIVEHLVLLSLSFDHSFFSSLLPRTSIHQSLFMKRTLCFLIHQRHPSLHGNCLHADFFYRHS